jgi:hypothetical protein
VRSSINPKLQFVALSDSCNAFDVNSVWETNSLWDTASHTAVPTAVPGVPNVYTLPLSSIACPFCEAHCVSRVPLAGDSFAVAVGGNVTALAAQFFDDTRAVDLYDLRPPYTLVWVRIMSCLTARCSVAYVRAFSCSALALDDFSATTLWGLSLPPMSVATCIVVPPLCARCGSTAISSPIAK